MADVVVDSSAVLADIQGEPGGEVTRAAIDGARISAVNFAEIITKLVQAGIAAEQARVVAETMSYKVIAADQPRAALAGLLHARTRGTGVSLGDSFCLALAEELGWPVLTADRRWRILGLGIEIRLIR